MNTLISTLSYPFRGGALTTNLIFACIFGFLLASLRSSGLLGLTALPALIIFLPWFVKYCLVVARSSANDEPEPPTLRMENLNPLDFDILLIVAGVFAIQTGVGLLLGDWAAIVVNAALVPLLLCVYIIEDSVIAAFNPLAWFHYASALGWAWPVIALALTLAGFALMASLSFSYGTLAGCLLAQTTLIGAAHLIGRILLIRQDHIGYELVETQTDARSRDEARRELRDFAERSAQWHLLAEAGEHGSARQQIVEFIAQNDDRVELYSRVDAELWSWRESTMAAIFSRDYIEKLNRLGDVGGALQVFERAFTHHPELRPIGERTTLQLAQAAHQASNARLATALLSDFHERFPDSAQLVAAARAFARLSLVHAEDAAHALRTLDAMSAKHRAVAEDTEIAPLRARLVTLAGVTS